MDVTGNFPVKSVYTVPLVSDAKNAINTSSLFSSGIGVMSSFPSSVSFCVEFILFCFRSKCLFAVAIIAVRCFATYIVLIPCHVTNCSFLMSFSHVDFTGLNKEVCRKYMISFLVAICSKFQTILSTLEVGMYHVSPSEVTNGIFHKVVAISRSPLRINFPLWYILQCFLWNVATQSLSHNFLIDKSD